MQPPNQPTHLLGWRGALLALALGLSLLSSVAQAAPPAPQQRQVVRAHMELGQHKLRAGQFKAALEHFEAALRQMEQAKGEGKALAQARFRATLGAALAHWRLGQPEEATRRGQEALTLARAQQLKQAERQALRFLDDPAEAAAQMAATAQELEKWLQSLETKP